MEMIPPGNSPGLPCAGIPFFIPGMHTRLIELLRRRESVIANHAWRDRDPAAHLDILRSVSGEITRWAAENDSAIDGKLRHFLANASFAKALAHAESLTAESSG